MSVRVLDIDHRILVNIDNKDIYYYDKNNVNWYVEDSEIVLEVFQGETFSEVLRRSAEDFEEPAPKTTINLLSALCDLSQPLPKPIEQNIQKVDVGSTVAAFGDLVTSSRQDDIRVNFANTTPSNLVITTVTTIGTGDGNFTIRRIGTA